MVAGCNERAQAVAPQALHAAPTESPAPPPPPRSVALFCVKDDPGQWLAGTSRFDVIGAPAAGDAWRGTATLTRTADQFHVVRVVAGKRLEGQAEKQKCGGGEYEQFLVRYDDGSEAVCYMMSNGNNDLRFVCDVLVVGKRPGMETWYEPPFAAAVD